MIILPSRIGLSPPSSVEPKLLVSEGMVHAGHRCLTMLSAHLGMGHILACDSASLGSTCLTWYREAKSSEAVCTTHVNVMHQALLFNARAGAVAGEPSLEDNKALSKHLNTGDREDRLGWGVLFCSIVPLCQCSSWVSVV